MTEEVSLYSSSFFSPLYNVPRQPVLDYCSFFLRMEESANVSPGLIPSSISSSAVSSMENSPVIRPIEPTDSLQDLDVRLQNVNLGRNTGRSQTPDVHVEVNDPSRISPPLVASVALSSPKSSSESKQSKRKKRTASPTFSPKDGFNELVISLYGEEHTFLRHSEDTSQDDDIIGLTRQGQVLQSSRDTRDTKLVHEDLGVPGLPGLNNLLKSTSADSSSACPPPTPASSLFPPILSYQFEDNAIPLLPDFSQPMNQDRE
jgi:hypothetical protein